MAKTIDREKNSAGRARRNARQPQAVQEAEPLNAAPSDDVDTLGDVDVAGEADEGFDDLDVADDDTLAAEDVEDGEADEDDEPLALAPADDEERAPTRVVTAGVHVPAFLLENPFTRPLAESYLELRKVTWPSRQDTWNMTIVVIVVSAIMAGLLALADYGLGHLLTWLVSIGLGH